MLFVLLRRQPRLFLRPNSIIPSYPSPDAAIAQKANFLSHPSTPLPIPFFVRGSQQWPNTLRVL